MGIIAIFGGSFNPIHIGHIEIIKQIRLLKEVEKVLIIPTKIPPHKDTDYLADATHRLNMCKIATEEFKNVEVSDIELNRDGKSYTIDTVNLLQKVYNNHKLALTIGGDMLISFDKWKDYKGILKKCILITFKRAGISDVEYRSGINKLKSIGAEIISIETDIPCVSSTQIRNELLEHKKCELLASKVEDYITSYRILFYSL